MACWRLDPRATRLAPPRTVEQGDVHTHATAFADGMFDQFPPRLAQDLDVARPRVVEEHVADQRLADAHAGHRLQVAVSPSCEMLSLIQYQ